jgi:hypothetical protein
MKKSYNTKGFFFETRSHYVGQVGLTLKIFLPQPPKCWVYRYVPPCPAKGFFYKRVLMMSLDPYAPPQFCSSKTMTF